MSGETRVRRLEHGDLSELVQLCQEHAKYERASWPEKKEKEKEKEAGLARLFLDSVQGTTQEDAARCWVVEVREGLGGFATASLELSTWEAQRYLHLDCLYLRAPYRGKGWGQTLVEHVARAALELGAASLQWQTPAWNRRAESFYRRLGATSAEKLRFTLSLAACAALLAEGNRGKA